MLIQFAVTVDGRVVGTESCEVWGAAAEVEEQFRQMQRRTGRMALEPALLQTIDQTPAPCCGQRRMQNCGRRVITGRTTFGESRVAAGDPASGVPTSATGTFVFTTSPVETDPALTSVLIAGPDRNNDNIIDDSIPVRSTSPSEFSFTVTFDGAGAVGATITDTIPKEWELVSATADDPNDVVTIGGTGAVQITHFDQFALLPSDLLTFWSTGRLPNFRFARPTTYEWQPTDDAGVLTVTVRTRPAVRRGRFQPLLRGTYPLNVGAAAFATDGNPLVDNLGEPLIGPRLTVQAR